MLEGGAVFELPAGGAGEGVVGAVEGADKVVGIGEVSIVVEIVADSFRVEREVGGVSVLDFGLVSLGDGEWLAKAVLGDGDIWGAIRIVGGGEAAGDVAVSGDASPCPGAGVETTGGGVGVEDGFVSGIDFGAEAAGGGEVVPGGQRAARGGGNAGGECGLGAQGFPTIGVIVGGESGVGLAAPGGFDWRRFFFR